MIPYIFIWVLGYLITSGMIIGATVKQPSWEQKWENSISVIVLSLLIWPVILGTRLGV